jgi:hypothetical protein
MVKRHRSPDDLTDVFYTDGTVDYSRVQGNNPLSGGEYPRMMYRAGGSEIVHGVKVDTLTVGDQSEEDGANEQGYRRTPREAERFGQTLLTPPALPAASTPDPRDEEIARLKAALEASLDREAPRRGRPRKAEGATDDNPLAPQDGSE